MKQFKRNYNLFNCLLAIRPVLKEIFGFKWIFILIKSLLDSKKLFKQTKWHKNKEFFISYIQNLLIIPSIYNNLKTKVSEDKSLVIIKEIINQICFVFDMSVVKENKFFHIRNSFQRWIKYRSTFVNEIFSVYNEIEDIYIDKNRIHYIVKKCIFKDVFDEAGTPELTGFICNFNFYFQNHIFKEYVFDRNGSQLNTIAYGNEVCHYVWKNREAIEKDYYNFIEEVNGFRKIENDRRAGDRRISGNDRRKFDRRKFDRRKSERYY